MDKEEFAKLKNGDVVYCVPSNGIRQYNENDIVQKTIIDFKAIFDEEVNCAVFEKDNNGTALSFCFYDSIFHTEQEALDKHYSEKLTDLNLLIAQEIESIRLKEENLEKIVKERNTILSMGYRIKP